MGTTLGGTRLVDCPKCHKEIKLIRFQNERYYPLDSEGDMDYIRCDLCGCPECNHVVIQQEPSRWRKENKQS